MYIGKAEKKDLPALKQLWTDCFDDGTEGFCDFAFTLCPTESIYIIREDEAVVSMLMAIAPVKLENQNGFYLYSACTNIKARGKGYMHRLIDFAVEEEKKSGNTFCILEPANEKLFDFYRPMGFTTYTYLRKFEIDIKKNIWQTADFDIVTASRFPVLRDKYNEGTILHFSPSGYAKVAEYIYTFGGSTAENKNAYAVYYVEAGKLIVPELFAEQTVYATQLLQAIRERTGCDKAVVSLPKYSNLFLGEGSEVPHCLIKGLDKDIYANLLFD